MKKIIYLPAVLLALTTACVEQRDLYDTQNVVLHVEGSWSHSLGEHSMQDATVMLHREGERRKEYFSRPNGATVRVSRGEYDVLVFNGVMESEDATNLDHVFFRGTDRLATFEVYAAEVAPMRRLSRAPGEYIASNEMEIFTFAHHRAGVDSENSHYMRYDNGRRTGLQGGDYIGGKVESTPRAMSFLFRVQMTGIVNPTSAGVASGALRGFLGSVYMPASGEQPRPGFLATHHLTLTQPSGNRTRVGPDGEETGMLSSPDFVTFGPPMPDSVEELPATGQYFFEPVFALKDGTQYSPGPIDVTAQVNEAIFKLVDHHDDSKDDIARDENIFTIEIDDHVTLPVVDTPGGGDNGNGNGPGQVVVDPWEDDEVVIIWIRA